MATHSRSAAAVCWSAAIGTLGAAMLVFAGMAVAAVFGAVGTIVGAVTTEHALDTGPIVRVTGLAVALCLAVSWGGGWVVAGAEEGLIPRWLAGLTTGLLGLGAGVVVLSLGLGWTPF